MLSVTQILDLAGLVDSTWFTADACDRGSALHKATQYLDEGTLYRDSVDSSIVDRFERYERFIAEVQPEILAIEEEVMNPALNYIGHLDRRLKINGREGILDLKPSPAPWHPLQLAGYAGCFARPMARWGLYLAGSNYKLVEYSDRSDWRTFQAALTTAQWIRRHVA